MIPRKDSWFPGRICDPQEGFVIPRKDSWFLGRIHDSQEEFMISRINDSQDSPVFFWLFIFPSTFLTHLNTTTSIRFDLSFLGPILFILLTFPISIQLIVHWWTPQNWPSERIKRLNKGIQNHGRSVSIKCDFKITDVWIIIKLNAHMINNKSKVWKKEELINLNSLFFQTNDQSIRRRKG